LALSRSLIDVTLDVENLDRISSPKKWIGARRELAPFAINKSSDESQLGRVDLRSAASRFLVANASRLSVSGVEINDGLCLLDLP